MANEIKQTAKFDKIKKTETPNRHNGNQYKKKKDYHLGKKK